VIAVADLPWTTELFHHLYGWISRETRPEPSFGATVVSFERTPVALASPLEPQGWFTRRLAQFGDSPAALLLRTPDLDAAERQFPHGVIGTWLNRPVLWLHDADLGNTWLGLTAGDGS